MFSRSQINSIRNKKSFILILSKNFGIGSFYSKYVILGCGYGGMTLAKFLTNVKF